MSAPFIMIDGDKGGVGKSFVARSATHCLIAWGIKPVGVDGDPRNAHLERYYGSTLPTHRPYLREPKGWDGLIDLAGGTDPASPILIDFPGNIGDAVSQWGPKLQHAATRLQRPIVRLWTLDEEDDVIHLLKNSAVMFPFGPSVIAVRNGRFGANSSFDLWEKSKTRAALLEAGGSDVYLPRLPPGVRGKIRDARCTFADATTKAGLSLSETIDLEMWISGVENAFAPLRSRLEGAR